MKRTLSVSSIALALGISWGSVAASAQGSSDPRFQEQARLSPSSLPSHNAIESFGTAVALSSDGTIALIGAPGRKCPGLPTTCGAAFVYVRQGEGWIEEAVLVPNTAGHPSHSQEFGRELVLSADGRTAFVSAVFEDCPSAGLCGAVYVFERNASGWILRQKLQIATERSAHLGAEIALSPAEDLLLVTAPDESCPAAPDCGAVYVFAKRNGTWVEEARLTAPLGSGNTGFGHELAWLPDGRRILIAGFQEFFCGKIYQYARFGEGVWGFQGEIQASGCVAGSFALSADGTELLAGTGFDVLYFTQSGDGWIERQSFLGEHRRPGSGFGHTIGFFSSRGIALVGAPFTSCKDADPSDRLFASCGSVHVFVKRGGVWMEQQEIIGAQPETFNMFDDQFGSALAVADIGALALVGAPGEDCFGRRLELCGGAYVLAPAPGTVAGIPTVNDFGLLLLAVGIAAGGAVLLSRRRAAPPLG